jgi:hypothetical protein
MIRRFAAAMGSMVTLVGAFIVGAVLHQTLVQNNYPITRPIAVFGLLAGVAVIAVGLRLEGRFEPSDYVPDAEREGDDGDDGEGEGEGDEGFDDRLSPVSEEMLEDREADESYDG